LPKSRKATKPKAGAAHAAHAARSSTISIDPAVVQRALNEAVKTLNSPEYRTQVTKMTQASIVNSLQTFQRLTQLSGRLSKMDNKSIETVVQGSITDLTRAFLQFNSDQLVLLQKLSARTLEILDGEVSKDTEESKK
jgi:hypothetical protein